MGWLDILGAVGGLATHTLVQGHKAGKARKKGDKIIEQSLQDSLANYDKQNITPLENPFASYNQDPSLRSAQMNSLGRYGEIVNAKGADPLYTQALNQAKLGEESRLRGEREATLRDAGRRGTNNLGYINNLMNAQQSAGREMERNTASAGEQYGRLMQALSAQGGLAGDISDRDFSQAFKKSSAQNEVDRYNRDFYNAFHQGRSALIGGQGQQRAQQHYDTANRKMKQLGSIWNTAGNLGAMYASGGLSGLSKQSTPSLEMNIPKYDFQTQNDLAYTNPNKPKYNIGGY